MSQARSENQTGVLAPEVHPISPEELRQRIARRAYEFYEQRGFDRGDELEDWLKAEDEIVTILLQTAVVDGQSGDVKLSADRPKKKPAKRTASSTRKKQVS
jgi:hypothetical protein